ncbi:DAHL domain-containing protein [Pseudomonas sp.]|uniref:DAHL domain-containing protein n=1 Tax=Pseudomonas sp. TaxID=306 RepID=UPI002C73301E|nr:DAHL domain-containing protein [Pseudomonas sp.]HUE90982.1 DAHL domain-containing protein [Pseudomonas sp.]
MNLPRQLSWPAMLGLTLVFAAALLFLYIKTQAYDPANYFEKVALLRQNKQLDAQWELDVLKSKIGLNQSYDQLVNPLSNLHKLHAQVATLGTPQTRDDARAWNDGRAAYQQAIEEKTRLIEHFKSHSAVLRNSLAFLPTAADDIHRLIEQTQGSERRALTSVEGAVNTLLLASMRYNQTTAADLAADIAAGLERLPRESGQPANALDTALDIFRAHVRTLLREQSVVNGLLNSIAAVPVAARIDDLNEVLSREQLLAAAQAQRYRQYLLTFSAVLAGLLLYVANRLVRSYAVIHRVNKALQGANESLEQRVQERTRELREAQSELVSTARQAGMAEIASNVLHNVGNVLNSVNVSADMVSRQVRGSKAQGLAKAVQLINEHSGDLGNFMTHDEKGKLLPGYLNQLVAVLASEQQGIVEELAQLTKSIDHIKEIVAIQQSYAGAASMVEPVQITDLLEDALCMHAGALVRHQVQVVKAYAEVPVLLLDKHRLLLILINLISNAKYAMSGLDDHSQTMTLSVEMLPDSTLRICVKDEGEGIAPENLTMIFAHGFTTRKEGHGFGLHSCAVAALEMGGRLTAHSDGPGKGALFTLELPFRTAGDNL